MDLTPLPEIRINNFKSRDSEARKGKEEKCN